MPNRPLTESDLDELLGTTFLKSVRHFSQTDSTNGQAIELLGSGSDIETPCLIYTESQTAGRGRGANQWWSQAGSLTFSVIVDTQEFGLTPEQQIKLPLLTGLAVLRTCESVIGESADLKNAIQLKWPNDVFLAGRKLAGILIEVPSAKSAESSSRHAVIGVGMNVNNTWKNAPDELQETGISLADHMGADTDRLDILKTFLGHLEKQIRSLSKGLPVLDGWSEHCLLTGKRVTLLVGDQEILGECLGLAPNGALMLKTAQGTRQFIGGIVKSWD
ncbi:biotin--[acetyl-CoA-carboxylase] ligase [Mariniblastus sp.]|nr:biotin--[acetyl-CoA-carboxylase] ligase [Mariniblastus sp.]